MPVDIALRQMLAVPLERLAHCEMDVMDSGCCRRAAALPSACAWLVAHENAAAEQGSMRERARWWHTLGDPSVGES